MATSDASSGTEEKSYGNLTEISEDNYDYY